MSTVNVSNVTNVTNIQSSGTGFNDVVAFKNSGGTENGKLCRVFVNFNGLGTIAIRRSFNVTSLTDNGVGDYSINFTNALSDANFTAVGSAGLNDTASANAYCVVAMNANKSSPYYRDPTTTQVSLVVFDSGWGSANTRDCYNINVAVFS